MIFRTGQNLDALNYSVCPKLRDSPLVSRKARSAALNTLRFELQSTWITRPSKSANSKIPLHTDPKTPTFRHRDLGQHVAQLRIHGALAAEQNVHRVMPLLQFHAAVGL